MVKEAVPSVKEGVKKRRKVGAAPETEPEQDLYGKVVSFEEDEAFKRTASSDSKLYFDTCKNIRTLLSEIKDLKSQQVDAETSVKVTAKCMQACSLIVMLKKLNRLDKVRTIAARGALTTEKQKVDSTNLQYHNLLYEAAHLTSEYKKCQQFKSKDEDIELISINDFLKEAPDALSKQFREATTVDEHALHIARLGYELEQRKDLAKLCGTLEEQKKQLAAEIIEQKNRLDGLTPKLQAVLKAAKPLQEHLGMPVDKIRNEHRRAGLLPDPLYLLYVNTDAYMRVYDICIELEIVGEEEDAVQWKQTQNTKALDVEDSEESDEDRQKIEESVEPVKKRRHRKSKSVAAAVDPQEEKKKRLMDPYPLSVSVTLRAADEGLTLKMLFYYLPVMHIITVRSSVTCPTSITSNAALEVLLGENVLSELFDDDSGTDSPNPSSHYQLRKVGIDSFRRLVGNVGFAYSWAQRLCGLDFITECQGRTLRAKEIFVKVDKHGANNLSRTSIEIVMKLIARRLKSRKSLATQLQKLEQNLYPPLPEDIQLMRSPVASLSKWSIATWRQFCESPAATKLVEAELVHSRDLLYSAIITRNKASLTALIAVKNDYPRCLPVFSLTLAYGGSIIHSNNSDDLRDMERAVNTAWSVGSSKAEWLLSAQLHYLSAYLDIYLETLDPNTFTQNMVFFKSNSGRNRMCPFKFRKIGAGIFTQT